MSQAGDRMVANGFLDAHALIIGIADYNHARKLSVSVRNDAHDLAALLVASDKCGYDPSKVHLLLDGAATRVTILAALDDLGRVARASDTVCIYFSGHGWRAPDAEESYLLPVDASRNKLETSAISASDFSARLAAIGAGRLVVLLDACHAGGAGRIKDGFEAGEEEKPFTAQALEVLATGSGRAIIASSKVEETSLILPGARNSAFTTALLEGFGGAADITQAGAIKLFGLFEYVAERVPMLTGDRQHPLLRTKIESNFAIALGSPAPAALPSEILLTRLKSIVPNLYPLGPADRDIWERSGGDLSQLTLGKSGRSIWFEAMKLLSHGGGGDIDAQRLITEALIDFPKNSSLLALI